MVKKILSFSKIHAHSFIIFKSGWLIHLLLLLSLQNTLCVQRACALCACCYGVLTCRNIAPSLPVRFCSIGTKIFVVQGTNKIVKIYSNHKLSSRKIGKIYTNFMNTRIQQEQKKKSNMFDVNNGKCYLVSKRDRSFISFFGF